MNPEQNFDDARYVILDTLTNEQIPTHLMYKKVKAGYWEKAYAKTIADYFEIAGGTATRVLTYILKNKDSKNRISATHRSISEEIGSSERSVMNIFKKLQDHNFLRKIRNGLYMLSPSIMRHGDSMRGVVMFKHWDKIEEERLDDYDE